MNLDDQSVHVLKNLTNEVMEWIEAITEDSSLKRVRSVNDLHEKLKDGIILCNLINKIQPGCIQEVWLKPKYSFQRMDNVQNFLLACVDYGTQTPLFKVRSLCEPSKQLAKDMAVVITGLRRLKLLVSEKGPYLID